MARISGFVVDVAEIPGEEIVNAMHRRDCDVQRVGFGTGGKTTFRDQRFSQILHLPVDP